MKVKTFPEGIDVRMPYSELLTLEVPAPVPAGATVWHTQIVAVVKAAGGFDLENCQPTGIEFGPSDDSEELFVTFSFRDVDEPPHRWAGRSIMTATPTQEELDAKLRVLGDRFLRSRWKHFWCPERPTTGYCYLVTEVLWFYGLAEGEPHELFFPDGSTHWYLQTTDGRVTDLTANQYGARPNYDRGHPAHFYGGTELAPRGLMSERGHALAVYLGYADGRATAEKE